MKEFAIFLSGLSAGVLIGLFLKRPHVRRSRTVPECGGCDVITCQNETGIPRITVKPRRLPASEAPTEKMPGQFPRSLESYLPEELKSHTSNK